MNPMKLGDSIRRERLSRNMSMRDLADACQLSKQTILNLEHGMDARVGTVDRVLEYLNLYVKLGSERARTRADQ